MMNLLHAELFKLTRRPLTWLLLAIFLGLMLLYLLFPFMLVALNDGAFSGGEVRLEILSAEQIDQFRRWLSFPGIFGTALGFSNSVGGICAIVLAAGALGSEYAWGTLRLQLARQPHRGRYLAAKVAALLIVLLAGILLALVLGGVFALVAGAVLGNTGSMSGRDLLLLPLGVARALFVMLPYTLVAIACCALGRSVLAGAAGGLIFLTLDASLGGLALATAGNPTLAFLYNLLVLQQNINTLVVLNSTGYGLDPSLLVRSLDLSLLPGPLQATLVITAYSALCYAAAHYLLVRRDIGGAA